MEKLILVRYRSSDNLTFRLGNVARLIWSQIRTSIDPGTLWPNAALDIVAMVICRSIVEVLIFILILLLLLLLLRTFVDNLYIVKIMVMNMHGCFLPAWLTFLLRNLNRLFGCTLFCHWWLALRWLHFSILLTRLNF